MNMLSPEGEKMCKLLTTPLLFIEDILLKKRCAHCRMCSSIFVISVNQLTVSLQRFVIAIAEFQKYKNNFFVHFFTLLDVSCNCHPCWFPVTFLFAVKRLFPHLSFDMSSVFFPTVHRFLYVYFVILSRCYFLFPLSIVILSGNDLQGCFYPFPWKEWETYWRK